MPRKPDSSAGFAKRAKSPTSAHSPAAVSVSMPRKQRSLRPSGVAAVRDRLLEHADQRRAALGQRLHRAQVVDEHRLGESVLEAQRQQPRSCGCVHALHGKRSPRRSRNFERRWRERIRSLRASSMQRTRSRKRSSASLGTNAKRSSPAANSRTSRLASRRSVFTRSPGALGIDPGATTRIQARAARPPARARTPSGPPHRPRPPDDPAPPGTRAPRARARRATAARAARRSRVKHSGNRLRLVNIKPDKGHTL